MWMQKLHVNKNCVFSSLPDLLVCVLVCLCLLGCMLFGTDAATGVHDHYIVILVQLQEQKLQITTSMNLKQRSLKSEWEGIDSSGRPILEKPTSLWNVNICICIWCMGDWICVLVFAWERVHSGSFPACLAFSSSLSPRITEILFSLRA